MSVTESYNATLAMSELLEHTDANVVLDNSAIYNICNTIYKRLSRMSDESIPTYLTMNRVIQQAVASLTSSLRFNGALYSDIGEF